MWMCQAEAKFLWETEPKKWRRLLRLLKRYNNRKARLRGDR